MSQLPPPLARTLAHSVALPDQHHVGDALRSHTLQLRVVEIRMQKVKAPGNVASFDHIAQMAAAVVNLVVFAKIAGAGTLDLRQRILAVARAQQFHVENRVLRQLLVRLDRGEAHLEVRPRVHLRAHQRVAVHQRQATRCPGAQHDGPNAAQVRRQPLGQAHEVLLADRRNFSGKCPLHLCLAGVLVGGDEAL